MCLKMPNYLIVKCRRGIVQEEYPKHLINCTKMIISMCDIIMLF